jgi:hypothetical protein
MVLESKVKISKKMGRPKKEIDQKAFESLCCLQCTKNEICEFLGISSKTLNKWCKEIYKQTFSLVFVKKSVTGKISHRRAGFKLAKTNAAVWIFLAKNMLGMRDQPVNDDNIPTATPVSVIIQVEDVSSDQSHS